MQRDASKRSPKMGRHHVLARTRPFGTVRLGKLLRISMAVPIAVFVLDIFASHDTTAGQEPNRRASSSLAPAVGTHETVANLEELPPAGNALGLPRQVALSDSAPPTRASFMANWAPVKDAVGYRLDVSTSPRFDSFVDGYGDLDVGGATGRAVTAWLKAHHIIIGRAPTVQVKSAQNRM